MFGFTRKLSEDVQQLEQNVKRSFEGVRNDTQNVYDWLNYLYTQNTELKRVVDEQTLLLKRMPTTKEQVRELIDSHYSFEPILERIRAIEHRVDSAAKVGDKVGVIESQQRDIFDQLRQLHSQVSVLGNDRRQTVIPRDHPRTVPSGMGNGSALAEKMVRIAVRNSKDVIRQSILKLIRLHGQMSGVALRESIVTEQGLCSKSSFYRILEEIEDEHEITVVDEGKEKRYLWGSGRTKKARTDD
jgi:hypothetical protein